MMMKKWAVIFLIFLVSGVLFASGKSETYSSSSAGYQMITEYQESSGTKVITKLNSFGLSMGMYSFYDEKDTGSYMDLLIYKPLGGSISINGSKTNYSLSNVERRIGEAMALGMAFRKRVNPNTAMLFGVGPAAQFMAADGFGVVLVGMAADVTVNTSLSDIVFFQAGLKGEMDLACYSIQGQSRAWITDYFAYSITPHVGVGIKIDR